MNGYQIGIKRLKVQLKKSKLLESSNLVGVMNQNSTNGLKVSTINNSAVE